MSKRPTMLLRATVIFVGLVVLALCIFILPEGISQEETGAGYSPIVIGMYLTAIPFFIALYQTLKLLQYVDKNKAFSDLSVKALKYIKYCAASVGLLYSAGLPYVYLLAQQEDAPGVIVIGFVIAFASMVIAVFAAVLQQLLRSAIEIKSENDLTV
jgi:hypothetical protein